MREIERQWKLGVESASLKGGIRSSLDIGNKVRKYIFQVNFFCHFFMHTQRLDRDTLFYYNLSGFLASLAFMKFTSKVRARPLIRLQSVFVLIRTWQLFLIGKGLSETPYSITIRRIFLHPSTVSLSLSFWNLV